MLKDKIKGTIIGVVIGATLTGGVAMAANTTTLYDVVANGIKIVVDGKKLNPTDAKGNKVEPMIYNGTTYLPVRAVADALGKAVYWDGPNYTVYLGEMDGKLEYPTVELENMQNISKANINNAKNFLTDNYGNTYNRACFLNPNARFLLNMKYSRFKATLYVPEGETTSDTAQFKIIADGRTIYTSPEMDKTSAPVNVDVNVTGYNDVELSIDEHYYNSNFTIRLGIAEAGFYQ